MEENNKVNTQGQQANLTQEQSNEVTPQKKQYKRTTHGWQWLIYIDVLIPAALFAIAFFTKREELGITLANVYHNYTMYIVNPIVNVETFTGIVGILLPFVLLLRANSKKRFGDILAILIVFALVFAAFYFEVNYDLLAYLSF